MPSSVPFLTANVAWYATGMVAVPQLYPVDGRDSANEPRVLLNDVPWSTYVVLRDSIASASVRMTYWEGWLEIMSPSRQHEVEKKQIARLLELFCLERDIPLFGYGSTTFRNEEKKGGLEPDECYSRGADKAIPDVALEVVKTPGRIDKLDVYRQLGVHEVWVFEAGAFRVLALRNDHYELIAKSDVFPELDLLQLAAFALRTDQHAALREFRALLGR